MHYSTHYSFTIGTPVLVINKTLGMYDWRISLFDLESVVLCRGPIYQSLRRHIFCGLDCQYIHEKTKIFRTDESFFETVNCEIKFQQGNWANMETQGEGMQWNYLNACKDLHISLGLHIFLMAGPTQEFGRVISSPILNPFFCLKWMSHVSPAKQGWYPLHF